MKKSCKTDSSHIKSSINIELCDINMSNFFSRSSQEIFLYERNMNNLERLFV